MPACKRLSVTDRCAAAIRHMYDTACPRCQEVGLVRFETVVKAGSGTEHFYCGRCGCAWRSAGERHTFDALDQADDKLEPSARQEKKVRNICSVRRA
jgi:transcription elongation factor Elf1